MRFLCVGAAVQDVFLSQSDAFEPVYLDNKWFESLELGQKFDVNKIDFSTGGGATNSAVTFARQGHSAFFLGTVGRDPAGIAVLEDLDREGVDTSLASYSRRYNTAYSVLLLAPNGERTILTYRGASTHFDKNNFHLDRVGKFDWLYTTSLAGDFEILEQLFSEAKAIGAKIAFNPGKGELKNRDQMLGLLPMVDILITNKDEMSQIVEGEDTIQLAKQASKLVSIAVVTDGSNGSVVCDGRQLVEAGLYNNLRRTIDRTGAGDAYGSGFVLLIAQGKSLVEAVKFASANSSEVCQQIGAKAGILRANAKIHDMPLQVREV